MTTKANKIILFFIVSWLAFSSLLLSVAAQGLSTEQINTVLSAYRKYRDVNNISIAVPTVVEVPIVDDFLERYDFSVFDQKDNIFEPHLFKQATVTNKILISVTANPTSVNVNNMVDNSDRTYTEFSLPDNAQGLVQLMLSSASPITSSALTVLLDNYVALPTSIELHANTNEGDKTIVASRRMDSQTINFPRTTSRQWTIILTYAQLLRITELSLYQENITTTSTRAIRFLAQPDHTYRIYFDADRRVDALIGEAGNLADNQDILSITASAAQDNPSYVISDIDGDSVADVVDNCVAIANTDQLDVNNNGRGDACDDFDRDGVINSKDNCINKPNRNQYDIDSDGIGDVCDEEESRLTERLPWLPWAGIGVAVIILVVLFVLTAKSIRGNSNKIE
ncbi:MAG: thrombospondin type 3 repeat-containing protein [Patescibacteria group bacterium]